jgi:uncharacterized protein
VETPRLITPELIEILSRRFALDWLGIHGARHWVRVRENGLRLAERTGASKRVVEVYAFVHDSQRFRDGRDPEHGERAAVFVRALRSRVLDLDDTELALLEDACRHHSMGRTRGDVTVRTCWDADRLDLGRVGIRPRAQYLCTDAARDPATIEWAYQRSVRDATR